MHYIIFITKINNNLSCDFGVTDVLQNIKD